MFNWGTYEFKDLNTGEIAPKEFFMNAEVEEVYDSEQFRTSTKVLSIILYDKYEKEYLNKIIKNKCQPLIETPHNKLLESLKQFEWLFNGTLGAWITDPVDFELKEGLNPICSIPYPVPKLHEEIKKKK